LESLHNFKEHEGAVYDVALDHEGRRLATASWDKKARVFSLDPKELLTKKPLEHKDWVYGVAFSPDGHYLATASADMTVKLWEWDKEKNSYQWGATFESFQNYVVRVAFSPDDKPLRLAAASWDGRVRLYDVKKRKLERTYRHDGPVFDVAFNPQDGQQLAVAGDQAWIYHLNVDKLTQITTEYVNRIGRKLTPKECQEYLRNRVCPD
jgi:WD40 repeat protein